MFQATTGPNNFVMGRRAMPMASIDGFSPKFTPKGEFCPWAKKRLWRSEEGMGCPRQPPELGGLRPSKRLRSGGQN